MTYKCPKSHDSSAPDFCSVCGEEIQGLAAAGAAAVAVEPVHHTTSGATETCPDCTSPRESKGDFCEVCGHNFVTGEKGEIPAAQPPAQPVSPPTTAPAVQPATPSATTSGARWQVVVTIEATDAINASPAPDSSAPPSRTFDLLGGECVIGRRSSSIDQAVPIDFDDGVSRRHAAIIFKSDGTLIVRDTKSSNGTMLNGKALVDGADYPLVDGDRITLGRWTVLTVKRI